LWDEQKPHKHKYTDSKYPKADLDGNFCRNPSGHRTIWCYTTDPKKRWDECVPRKTCPPVEITIEEPVKPLPPPTGPERCSGKKCSGYRGRQWKTISGRTCMKWSV
jgi:hypothetical protein